MTLPSQVGLENFYYSVGHHDAALAMSMVDDIQVVALWALGADKSGGQAAANRLREATRALPVVFGRVLDGVLADMGYS
jgi:hypothetical protein